LGKSCFEVKDDNWLLNTSYCTNCNTCTVCIFSNCTNCNMNRIRCVMVSMLALSVVDSGFEPRSGQTIDYKTGICCFSAKHTALRKKCKDWLTWNQDNVSRWGNMFISWLLILYKADLIIISLKIYLFSPWHSWKIAELALSNNHPVVICIFNYFIICYFCFH
jgi:hypothetical protein